MRRVMFTGDRDTELLLHMTDPLLDRLPSTLQMFHGDGDGHVRSAAQSLVAMFTADPNDPEELRTLYLRCLDAYEGLTLREASAILEVTCRQLVHDVPVLPDSALVSVLGRLMSSGVIVTPELRRVLHACVRQALGRGGQELEDILNEIRAALMASESDGDGADLLTLVRAVSVSGDPTWPKRSHRLGEKDLSSILGARHFRETAARHPSAVVELLRLAADLGLDQWLATHARTCLQTLPPNAFGLLRPSDLTYLRKALPPGAYTVEFANVERTWRGGRPAPVSTPTDTQGPSVGSPRRREGP